MTKKRIAKNLGKIKVKSSKIHGRGVYAKKHIKKGEKIIEYVGRIITKKQSEEIAERQIQKSKRKKKRGAVYIFELNKRYDIDGDTPWNKAKYINHSCSPNAETVDEDGHIWIIAIRDIQKGEEITYNYGYSFENYKDHQCKCGSENCVGYILAEKYWPLLKKEKNNLSR
ncbi:SET domain-containing protein-lysine N-methyltransferase [Candidatus Pacearchaeota archaeon ex4484_71]|nr:MAG: SET domain-containing protein-lysine N-methyltransferase [Candidatus Pacearchaeota archaeon ex4484_71]